MYSYDNKGTYSARVSGAWKKIALWTAADNVELDTAVAYSNMPTGMQNATNLAAILLALDTATGASDGYATLDGTGKLPVSQMPSAVGGGMALVAAVNASTQDLDDLAAQLSGDSGDAGSFFTVTTAGSIDHSATTAKWEANTYDDNGDVPPSITLEVGDMILCTGYDTDHSVFAVINNAYGDATTSAKGVVTLATVTNRASLSGNDVVTEGNLATILNDDILVDGDFATAGYMKTDGSGGYSIDNNTYLTQGSFDSANNELASIQALADTVGFLRKTGNGTYTIDTSSYITDYTVLEADVTAHQAALSITESQISDFGTYLTSETSHADVLVDGDFATNGFMTRTGAGVYTMDASTYQTQVTISASSPTGGNDNDIWVQTS